MLILHLLVNHVKIHIIYQQLIIIIHVNYVQMLQIKIIKDVIQQLHLHNVRMAIIWMVVHVLKSTVH